MKQRMWAVDVEGSGMSLPEIVELAIVEMCGLELTGKSNHWRLKPKGEISPFASKIHGIRKEDVADAPDIEDIAGDVLICLGNAPIVGHNVRVEYALLLRDLHGWRPQAAVDTLWIARHLLRDEKNHGLERLGSVLGLDVIVEQETGGVAHSALYDATLAARLLRHLLGPLSDTERQSVMLEADILRGKQGVLL